MVLEKVLKMWKANDGRTDGRTDDGRTYDGQQAIAEADLEQSSRWANKSSDQSQTFLILLIKKHVTVTKP